MSIDKKWLERLSRLGFKALPQKIIRAKSGSFDG
jgi:hypothetical protein